MTKTTALLASLRGVGRLSARALEGLLRALDLLQLRLNMLSVRGGKGCFAFVLMEDRELKGCELFESIPREYPPWACPPPPPTPAELAKRLFRVKVSVGNTREMVERELAGAPADGDSGKRSSSHYLLKHRQRRTPDV